MARDVDIAFASALLTLSGNAGNTQTVAIGGKVYTFQTVLTNVDGNVLIGATASLTIDNLAAAINAGDGAGTAYAAATVRNEKVLAKKQSASTLRVYAGVAGSIGNHVPVAETLASGSWDNSTLTGGSGGILPYMESVLRLTNMNGEAAAEFQYMMPDR